MKLMRYVQRNLTAILPPLKASQYTAAYIPTGGSHAQKPIYSHLAIIKASTMTIVAFRRWKLYGFRDFCRMLCFRLLRKTLVFKTSTFLQFLLKFRRIQTISFEGAWARPL